MNMHTRLTSKTSFASVYHSLGCMGFVPFVQFDVFPRANKARVDMSCHVFMLATCIPEGKAHAREYIKLHEGYKSHDTADQECIITIIHS